MKPTDMTLSEQLRITSHEIVRRKDYMDILPSDEKILLEAKPLIAQDVDVIVEEFYVSLLRFDEAAQLIGDSESLQRLKLHLRRYVLSLFDGQYDQEYVLTRLRIGLVHKRIGVPPKLYVAALNLLSGLLRSRLLNRDEEKGCRLCDARITALEKVIAFDLVLVFDTYIQGLMNEVHRRQQEAEDYASTLEKTVAQRTKELNELARKDGMTGLYNQRSFYEELRREMARSQRRNQVLTLCYIDLDGFKIANDTHGHKYGDAILINLAESLKETLRTEDLPARYGGDEFCVILPQTATSEAEGLCRRIMDTFHGKDPHCAVTLSIGVAESTPDDGLDADMLVKRADEAMYLAKKQKGSVVQVYSEPNAA